MLKILTKGANLRVGMGRLFCLLLIAAVLIPSGLVISPVSAQAPPGLPAIFYGTVTTSGSPAAAGTVIQAQINSAVQGSFTVATAGSYGNMLVSNGNDGDTVQFYVNGVAAQTAVYHPGERNPIALSTGGGGSAPVAPVLSSPASGATGVSTASTLQWTATSGAATYAVQVSTASSFATIAFSQSAITATSVAISPALTAGTLYYWRANATNTYGSSAWTSAWSFTTASVAPPSAPALLSPSNGATGVATSPLLQWGPSTGATSYNVQVSTSSAFSSFAFTQSGSATAVTVTPALSGSTAYYWRANATGAGGTSSWSSTWSFTTAGSSPPSIPAFFKGVAYKNGAAVNAKQVCAVINSGSTCAASDTSGNYIVSVTGTPGDTVTFTVDSSAAAETATYSPGWMTTLNLHAGTGVLAVTTGSGTYVNSTSATLSGTLLSLSSLDTTATPSIDYGPTTAYEWGTWTMSSMAPGVFTTPAVTGLTAGQVIHFKAKAVGDTTGATASGSDATYTHTPLTITTTSLTGGTIGTAYSQTLAASGGTTPYTWSYTGTMPPGLSLNTSTGAITGTPTTASTYPISVSVADSAAHTAGPTSLSITISSGGTFGVTTGSGAYAGTSTATLTGTLTGLGSYSSNGAIVSIQYGTTTAYGSTTTPVTLTSTGAFSGTATGLSSGVTYNFRAKAVGNVTGGATVYGSNATYVHSNTAACGSCSIGSTTGDIFGQAMANYVWLYPSVANTSTTISHIALKAMWTGTVKVAIYDNEGNLLNANNIWQPIVAGCNSSLTVPTTSVAAGTTYWLALMSSTQTVGFAKNVTGDSAYQVVTSMDTFPTAITGTVYHLPYSGLICGTP